MTKSSASELEELRKRVKAEKVRSVELKGHRGLKIWNDALNWVLKQIDEVKRE